MYDIDQENSDAAKQGKNQIDQMNAHVLLNAMLNVLGLPKSKKVVAHYYELMETLKEIDPK